MNIQCKDGIEFMKSIENNSVDLILTDPPYIISRESGMNSHFNKVKLNERNNVEFVKSDEEWLKYKTDNNILNDDKKLNYRKYGSIYGLSV